MQIYRVVPQRLKYVNKNKFEIVNLEPQIGSYGITCKLSVN